MSFRGGGDAGGRAPSRAGPEYVRHIPKFLQKYEHLMEKREGQKIVRHATSGDAAHHPVLDAKDDDDDDFNDQIRGATVVHDERDPTSLPCPPETAADDAPQPKWVHLKEEGNAAYARGDHRQAVRLFTDAIQMCSDNAVLHSNRAAARAAMHEYEESLLDAQRALELQPGWGKAHSRVAAALLGLGRHEEAVQAYERALEAEPGSAAAKQGLEQARRRIQQQEEKDEKAGRHRFRKRKGTGGTALHAGKTARGSEDATKFSSAGALSFAGGGEESSD